MRWVPSRLQRHFSRRAGPPDAARYWRERARQWGARAAVDLRHDPSRLEAVTRRQREEMAPPLRAALGGGERIALDFGCGPGRFTAWLAGEIGGRALGVDICPELLAAAPPHPSVAYAHIGTGPLPLRSGSADVAFLCLVLGGITESGDLERSAGEILRVLAPDGLLFLVENTSALASPRHWHYRTVADYRALFAPLALRHCGDYHDLGETFSILAGRRGAGA